MFSSKTAWFSSSVPQDRLDFWMAEGGSIIDWRQADYLFSQDATCPDTLVIFESDDYISKKVTIFHSLFLSTCEKRQSVKSVSIGHYVLPPASVQDEVREVVGRLIWEHEDEETIVQEEETSFCLPDVPHSEQDARESISEESDMDSAEGESHLCDHFRSPVSCVVPGKRLNMQTDYSVPAEYISIETLQKYSGDLHDVHPGVFRCSKCKDCLCLGQKYAKAH
ncbi:telomere repeats-binding bouquet formation protein 2 [Poecilia reticulata]|uniref:Telomere repeat binding bouquet formation protein 2 n=1 Tax=Poecilia reticulata TaxID=8081 RepID=A0A3P9QI73_POERE|nr:PREDICTED: telomere repeats-binding bouquet formation protein 2 [Poecilia reticulata]